MNVQTSQVRDVQARRAQWLDSVEHGTPAERETAFARYRAAERRLVAAQYAVGGVTASDWLMREHGV